MWNGACPFWNGGVFGTWGWVGMILYLLFWVGLIAGVVYLVVRLARRAGPVAIPAGGFGAPTGAVPPASALEIAQMRYARGEINRETYLQLVEDLHQEREP